MKSTYLQMRLLPGRFHIVTLLLNLVRASLCYTTTKHSYYYFLNCFHIGGSVGPADPALAQAYVAVPSDVVPSTSRCVTTTQI